MYILCTCFKVGMFWKLYSTCVVAPERGLLDLLSHWQTHRISHQPVCKTMVHLILLPCWPSLRPTFLFSYFSFGNFYQAKTPHGQTHWMLREKKLGESSDLFIQWAHWWMANHIVSPGVSRVRGTFSKFTSSKLAPSNDAPVRSDLEKSEPPRSAWRFCHRCKSESFNWFFRKNGLVHKIGEGEFFKMIWINLKKKHIRYMIW